MPNRIPNQGSAAWDSGGRRQITDRMREAGVRLQDKWHQPKHPPWPPYWVAQLPPNWFILTGKSNLICKLHTTQFRGEVAVDLHIRSPRVKRPLLCTATAIRSLQCKPCWSRDATGRAVEVRQWKQIEMMTRFTATHASVVESNSSVSRLSHWPRTTGTLHNRLN